MSEHAAVRTENGTWCAAVVVEGLSKSYATRLGWIEVFRDLNFTIPKGEFVGVLGRSGCGKSTLVHILGGFTAWDAGSVRVDGRPVRGAGPDRAVVFQEDALFPWLTVVENVEMGMRGRGFPKETIRRESRRMLERVGMAEYGDLLPRELSGGMKQRVALARALVLKPRLLLMDEPFASLDAQTRSEMHELLLGLRTSLDQTILLVSHDIEEVLKLADSVWVLGGTPSRIVRKLRVPFPVPRRMDVEESPLFLRLKSRLKEDLTTGGYCSIGKGREEAWVALFHPPGKR